LVVAIFVGWLLLISGLVAAIGAFALRGTGLFLWEMTASATGLQSAFEPLLTPSFIAKCCHSIGQI
jgi:uncharacterized membrane protein HdeD (DUF308 family)